MQWLMVVYYAVDLFHWHFFPEQLFDKLSYGIISFLSSRLGHINRANFRKLQFLDLKKVGNIDE